MAGGGLLTIGAMLLIAYAKEIGSGLANGGGAASQITAWIAVLGFYVLDFSINAVMAAARALSLDIPSVGQQSTSSAWAGRFIGLGNIAGYLCGFMDLPRIFPFLGDTQMKILCWLAITIFTLSLSVTCYSITERQHHGSKSLRGFWEPLTEIWKALRRLPAPIQGVCNVQFFSWIGWFPIFFYGTSWVAEKCTGHPLEDAGSIAEECTREGARAMFVFALVSTVTSFVVPWLNRRRYVAAGGWRFVNSFLPTTPHLWFGGCLLMASAMLATFGVDDAWSATVVISICGISWGVAMYAPFVLIGEHMRHIQFRKDAVRTGYISEPSLSVSGSEHAGRPHRTASGSSLARSTGNLVGEVSSRSSSRKLHDSDDETVGGWNGNTESDGVFGPKKLRPPKRRPRVAVNISERRESDSEDESHKALLDSSSKERDLSNLQVGVPRPESIATVESQATSSERSDLATGTVIGIQNLYVVVPQFITTFLSSIIFAIVSHTKTKLPDGAVDSYDAFAWVLRFGGLGAILAAMLCLRLKDVELDVDGKAEETPYVPVTGH
ncbi:hypothetical protein HDU93_007934 [Gonapodya sp. JEL0774]|nr:hypothetical protein HDU93_007934 [Gonapodya sp. JEL0774]